MTPKRAFWEAFATVCLPSLILWTVFAYLLRSKLNLPYAKALPIYLFLAILPMPLAFPVYRRYLRGAPRDSKTLSPKLNIALAIFFAVVGILHAAELPRLLRSHKSGWDVVFHVANRNGLASHEHRVCSTRCNEAVSCGNVRLHPLSCCKQAMSQVCAVCSPFLRSKRAMAMFRQLAFPAPVA